MSEAERAEQRISFAYGNVNLHNEAVTRQHVERLSRLKLGPPEWPFTGNPDPAVRRDIVDAFRSHGVDVNLIDNESA